jgi:putative CocE/NonD family hydrolase
MKKQLNNIIFILSMAVMQSVFNMMIKLSHFSLAAIIVLAWSSLCVSQQMQRDVMIPMRDGIQLATDIAIPDSPGKYPVILVRTPYGKSSDEDDAGSYWAEKGFAFVIQDCRATGNSQGKWYPAVHEKDDGIDTRNWILGQSWCNGKIGTTGGSYLGYTQFASYLESNQSLKVMFAMVPAMEWYKTSYISGTLSIGTAVGWALEMAHPSQGEGALFDIESRNIDEVYRTLPLTEFDRHVDTTLTWLRDIISNPTDNKYWSDYSGASAEKSKGIPLFTVSGWFDIFVDQALEYHGDMIRLNKKNQHLIVGPWAHGPNEVPGDRKLKANQEIDFGDIEEKWFDYWLKGANEKPELPPFKIYVMGKNIWRDENEWPLKRTQYQKYFLHSSGDAHLFDGSGQLSPIKPGQEKPDSYVYDPEYPVPTHGGALLFDEPGMFDQREIEMREDVLIYSSELLEKEIEVTGPVKVILYASSDARDTDWTAKLVDVYPDGRAFNLCDGIVRARYHQDPLISTLINPGQVYKYEIDLWATSNVFLPGHRIRVEISSSNFPRCDRNPNTGNAFGLDANISQANQTVYHNAENPSHIILPVIPDFQN